MHTDAHRETVWPHVGRKRGSLRVAAAVAALVYVLLGTAEAAYAQCGASPLALLPTPAVAAQPIISGNGRYVAFTSTASTLVANDTNGSPDVFVYDRLTCAFERISVNSDEVEGNYLSQSPRISDDGNAVAFMSMATNLVVGELDVSYTLGIYVRDRVAGTTVRASISSAGVRANADTVIAGLSGDGSTVAFISDATNLVPGDTNNESDVFVRAAGVTTRVSVTTGGSQGESYFDTGVTGTPSLSTDGRYVAFISTMNNLVPNDLNNRQDAFRHDRLTQTTVLASIAANGYTQSDQDIYGATVSADGRDVTFLTTSGWLVDGDNNSRRDVFVRNVAAATTERVSLTDLGTEANDDVSGGGMSADGRYMVFDSRATNLVVADTNGQSDVFVRDRVAERTFRVNVGPTGVQANGFSFAPSISGDGQIVVFSSGAWNLLPVTASTLSETFVAEWPQLPAAPDVIANGGFGNNPAGWLMFGSPYASDIVWNLDGGVFEFYRQPPAPGTTNQAVVFQETGLVLGAGAPLLTRFDLGNSDSVRKRISVLIHDADFSDLAVCTFWLPANAALQTYEMRTHTTRPWSNGTISFYAATPNLPGNYTGRYRLDNVTMRYAAEAPATETTCHDPTVPAPPGGVDGSTLLVNGNFDSGTTAPGWNTFGQISSQVSGGVFQFIKEAGSPAGVVLQTTGQPLLANEVLTASFELGNSSSVRKRVTVILHDLDFSDLSACTFWLEPGQPLSSYIVRTFSTKAWANTTLSVYPATAGAEQWIRFDNAALRRTPAAVIAGTECVEPGAGPDARISTVAAPGAPLAISVASPGDAGKTTPNAQGDGGGLEIAVDSEWIGVGFDETVDGWVAGIDGTVPATLARAMPLDLTNTADLRFVFRSWLTGIGAQARVEVMVDGVNWEPVHVVDSSDTWMPVQVDLGAYAGHEVDVRFVLDAAYSTNEPPITWRIDFRR